MFRIPEMKRPTPVVDGVISMFSAIVAINDFKLGYVPVKHATNSYCVYKLDT